MKNTQRFILMCMIGVASISCVSTKTFEAANQEIDNLKSLSDQQAQKITDNEKQLSALETKNKMLTDDNNKMMKDMKTCSEAKEAVSRNLEALNGAIKEQYGSLQQLNDKAKEGLEKFAAAGIDVNFVDGLVHLSIENYLMFTGESTTVGWEGKQALAVVADVVNDFPGTSIYVIGNTDNTPAASASKDNWTLSTTSANAVVRVLTQEYKVDPTRIISGGRAQYHPVADNASSNGRNENKRIDIFINPNLEKMWKTAETIK